jgi:hypothetical protein
VANQTAAVAQATATPAGNTSQATSATTSQLASTATTSPSLQPVTSTATLGSDSSSSSSGLPWPLSLLPNPSTPWWQLTQADYTTNFHNMFQIYNAYGVAPSSYQMGQQLVYGPDETLPNGVSPWYPPLHHVPLGRGGGPLSAGVGQAGKAGALSVPQSWPTSTPEAEPVGAVTQGPAVHAAATGAPSNALLRGVPTGNGGRRTEGFVHKYGWRYSVITRPPAGG